MLWHISTGIPMHTYAGCSKIARFTWPTWGPPGSCRPQVGPMLTPWTLLSGLVLWWQWWQIRFEHISYLGNNTEPWPSNQPHLTCSNSDEPPTCHEVDVCTIRPLKRSEWLHLPYVSWVHHIHIALRTEVITHRRLWHCIYMGIKHRIKIFYLSFCSLLDIFFCIFNENDFMWQHTYIHVNWLQKCVHYSHIQITKYSGEPNEFIVKSYIQKAYMYLFHSLPNELHRNIPHCITFMCAWF